MIALPRARGMRSLHSRRQVFDAAVLAPLRQSPGRSALSILAIALGVALGFAIYLINRSAADEMSVAARSLFGLADFSVQGTAAGFNEDLYPQLAGLPGVAFASPVVEVQAKLADRPGTLLLLGIDAFRAGGMQPALAATYDSGVTIGLSMPDDAAVFLSSAAAATLALREGDELVVQAGLDPVTLRVAGVLPAAAYPQRLGVVDIATAQWRFERLGRLSRVDLRLEGGADTRAVRTRVERLLPPGVRLTTPGERTDDALRLSRAYRANLTALALVALFTGGFLVFATQSLAVVRRRRELALLRALGVTAREQIVHMLSNGALIGVAGALLGVLAGAALAQLGLRLLGSDLGAGYFSAEAANLTIRPAEWLLFLLLGIAAAMIGALIPAVQAARVEAAEALKSGDYEPPMSRGHGWLGGALAVAGLTLLLLPPVNGLALPAYLSIALLLVGAVFAMPSAARLLLQHLPPLRSAVYEVAVAQLRGTGRHVTASIATILVSFSLMVAMAIMVTSFRTSLAQWMERLLPADLYLRAGYTGHSSYLDPGVVARVQQIPGVEIVEANRFSEAVLPGGAVVALIARPIDATRADQVLWMRQEADEPAPAGRVPVWASEAAADLHGLAPGRSLQLRLDERDADVFVQGVWRDYERQAGGLVMDRDAYRRITGDGRINTLWLWLAPAASLQGVSSEIRRQLPADAAYDLRIPAELRAASLRLFDRTFAVTYVLEIVAVLIGLLGISASAGAQVLARRAEFGMLRHLGFTRRQIGAALAFEGAALGAVGVLAGLAMGAVVSLILVYVVNRQSFHWSMDLYAPYSLLIALSLALVLAAALTSLWSARQAMSDDAVRAVREDW